MSDFLIRHYVPEKDLPSLSQMLTEAEAVDRDGEDTTEEYLRSSLTWVNYRPDQDVWVAESDGKLVGYGVAFEQPSQKCTLYVIVHPSSRRKGLGSRLLELTIARANAVGSKELLIYANEQNHASNSFLKNHAFLPVGSSGMMKASGNLESSSYEFPAGFSIKRYSDVNEPRILLKALNECYRDMWGHQHNDKPTEEDLRSPRFLNHYEADDILLLFDSQNNVSGICSVKSNGKRDKNSVLTDLLDAPGVIKEYREGGFQRQLVLAGIQHLRKRGNHTVILEFFGDNQKVLNIYRDLGFKMINQYTAYHKELE